MALQTAGGNDSSVFVGVLAKRLPDPDADGTPYWGHLVNEASTPAAVNAYFDANTSEVYGTRTRLSAGHPGCHCVCLAIVAC
jgi:hypothetical protein